MAIVVVIAKPLVIRHANSNQVVNIAVVAAVMLADVNFILAMLLDFDFIEYSA